MIPGDGEHGAAGICYGATTAGGRVFNATSANGLLFGFEQLPVQSGTRFPMVFNIVTRSVSGPLDIRGDHSDIMLAMNTGWVILMASDVQAVYDMNIMAPKIGEDMAVRLPVMVAFDGFFTSHQKRRVEIFSDMQVVQDFLGPFVPTVTSVDPRTPVTIGPYMNDPDLINNKKQQADAIVRADAVIKKVFAEYEKLSGRSFPVVELYRMEDAEAALFLLNSAAETAKEAVDALRKQGKKVGLIRPNVIRPFPLKEIREALKKVKGLVVADRQDNFGAYGGAMTLEVKAALQGRSSSSRTPRRCFRRPLRSRKPARSRSPTTTSGSIPARRATRPPRRSTRSPRDRPRGSSASRPLPKERWTSRASTCGP
jgi:pyruvate ferredoxin oxidoreductase alpha subunit